MKERLVKRIDDFTSIIGVSGHEWDVARYVKKSLEGFVDSIEMMPTGTVIARKKGAKPGPTVMYGAHMDEVGYVVKRVSSQGFLFFDRVGYATEACLPARPVLVKGDKEAVKGVIGVRSGHMLTAEQLSHPQTTAQSYVDIGCSSKEEVEALGIGPGSQIVPESPLTELNGSGIYVTRAADCRALCAVLVEAMRSIDAEELHGEVCAVFTTLEETALKGACPPVNYLNPLYSIFLDTIPCGDVPDCDYEGELPIALNDGPVIVLSQACLASDDYACSHPKLVEAARKACESVGVEHQEISFNGATYLTDAVTAQTAGNGTAVMSFTLPRRYSHAATEVFSINDAVDLEKALIEFMKMEIDLCMF